MTNSVQTLVKKLTEAREAYYNQHPVMTDAAYDALEDELRKLDPDHPHFKKVGAPVAGAWPKANHVIPMMSLNKAQDPEDLAAWYKSCDPVGDVVVMDKMDGCSIALTYVKGELTQALTRGDGNVGEDITRNVLLMKGVPRSLGKGVAKLLHVRGEIICKKSDFAQHFPGESNPRNTANGTAKRRTDPEPCRYLTVVAYQMIVPGKQMRKQHELTELRSYGFQTPEWAVATKMRAVEADYQLYVQSKRAELDYDVDGLVVEIDDPERREQLGELNKRPRGAVAYKFPHDAKPTNLLGINWQVGGSGRVTPVAVFGTVSLAGANVSQASLHNISTIEALCAGRKPERLRAGDRLLVSRRNDVIPYIEEVLVPNDKGLVLDVPDACPSCKARLGRDGEYLVCTNDNCEAQRAGIIRRWVEKIGVLDVGSALIDMLVETGRVRDIADLYTLKPEEVADMTMGGRSVGGTGTKAVENLRAKMTLPLHLIVGSLGIPSIGRSMAKVVVDAGYNSIPKMLAATVQQIEAIPGMGESKAADFVAGIASKRELLAKLDKVGIKVQRVGAALAGKSFCMTGFRDKELEQAIEAQGGAVKSSVGKGLTYLVALDPTSGSSKVEKAKKYGTQVIGVEEARALVKP